VNSACLTPPVRLHRGLMLLAVLTAAGCGLPARHGDDPTPAAPRAPLQWLVVARGEALRVEGRVVETGPMPVPNESPYRDHIVMLRLEELTVDGRARPELAALVYVRSMQDNVLTPAAGLRAGETVTLRVRSWSEVARFYQTIQRGEVDGMQDRPVAWGEL
jgi:hypothetical protein